MHPLRNLQYSHTQEVATNTLYGNSSRISSKSSSIMALPQQTTTTSTNTTTNYINYDSGVHDLLAVIPTIITTTTTTITTTNSATNTTTATTTQKNVLNCQQQQQQQQQHYYKQQQQQRLSMPVIFGKTDSNTYWSNTSTYGQTKVMHARNKSASLLNQGNRHTLDRKSAASTIKFLAESKPTYCNNATTIQQQQQQHKSSSSPLNAALLTNSITNGIGSSVVSGNTAAGVIDGGGKIMLPTLKCNRLPQAPTTINESVQTSVRRLSSDFTRKFDYRPIKVNTNSNFCAKEHQPLKNGNNLIAATTFASSSYAQNENTTDDSLVLTENYRPISPPAEYASGSTKKLLPAVPTLPVPPSPKTRAAIGSRLANKPAKRTNLRYNYQRSRSHCHEMPLEDSNHAVYGSSTQQSSYNINSHKSLPDLHSQICRHSPHSEVFSCCSRGNKSIKSMGAESSLNRDSGSSGHYTHRSEPCYRMYESGGSSSNNNQQGANNKNLGYNNGSDYRRDSGSSTQHTPLSYGGGYITTSPMSSPYHDYLRSSIDCTQCLAKQQYQLQQQQQQQQQHQIHLYGSCGPPAESNNKTDMLTDYRGNYATLEVPTAFQDDYKPLLSPPAYSKTYKPTTSNNNGHQSPCHQYTTTGCYTMQLHKQQQQHQQQLHQQQQQQQHQQQQYYQQNQRYQQQQQMNAYRQQQQQHKQQQQHLQQLQQQQQHQQQQQQQLMKYMSLQHSPTSVQLTSTTDDISPPAIQFKRQKCIRFKNRQQRFVLGEHACGTEPLLMPPPTPPPSANNTELCGLEQQQHQHHQQQQQQQQQAQYFNFPKCYASDGQTRRLSQGYIETNRYSGSDIPSPPRQYWPPLPVRDYEPLHAEFGAVADNVIELERFFDRLGLNDESFYEIYVRNKKRNGSGSDSDHSSTVFFSDVSTVDSMRLPDSSETQVTTTQPYRPTEPLSIVERNARIIKWLCNIRKAQNV